VSTSREYAAPALEGEALDSHNKALARRAHRDKTLKVEVDQALQSKDWLTKLKRVWEDVR
jgi:hypothetical protein